MHELWHFTASNAYRHVCFLPVGLRGIMRYYDHCSRVSDRCPPYLGRASTRTFVLTLRLVEVLARDRFEMFSAWVSLVCHVAVKQLMPRMSLSFEDL